MSEASPQPAAPDRSLDLEGVRPRSTVCDKCGYEVSRVAIKDDHVTCPECGHAIPFALTRPHTRRLVQYVALSWLAAAAVLFVVVLLSGWVIAWLVRAAN